MCICVYIYVCMYEMYLCMGFMYVRFMYVCMYACTCTYVRDVRMYGIYVHSTDVRTYVCMYVCKAYVHTACPLVLSFHPPAPPSILVPSVRSSVRLSVYPSIFPLIHPPTHRSIYFYAHPLTYLSSYPPTYLPFPWKSDILLPWDPMYYCSWRSLFCHSLHSNSRRLYTLSNNSRLLFYAQRFFLALLCYAHSRYPNRPS